ncbi:MAG: IS3 family transposase [Bacteroidetes bacterium]|nr:IS3 family transposase [Bacteroidota bacterium]MBI3423348.1 IS3 family transposase [Acidobacteriota bacterium]
MRTRKACFHATKRSCFGDGAERAVAEAELESFDYIERYYNPIRRHSALGYLSPQDFEAAYYQTAKMDSLKLQERT